MHSPEVLAFSIVRPWPTIHKKPIGRNNPKWALPIRRRADGSLFTSRFAYFNGAELYWPSIIDIWHMEPGGADSLTVCQNKIYDSKTGKFKKFTRRWRWHFWHWKITPVFLYGWRRYLFTRCAECGGPSRKGNVVNHSDAGWGGGPKVPLWCGEVHLYHAECLSKKSKRHHDHDPRGCYSCSGKESFAFNRSGAAVSKLPRVMPNMPIEQRKVLESLNLAVKLNVLPHDRAVETYNSKKLAARWV